MVVSSQQSVDKGKCVNFHVTVVLVTAQAELDARDQLYHVVGQGPMQDQDELHQQRETSLSSFDLPLESLHNIGQLGLQ